MSYTDLEDIQLNKAINPNNSVWVSASAGTGKTRILTKRVLRLLLEAINPEKILCLTFTNAAAGEMRERITKELKKWSILEEKDLIDEIKALIGSNFTNDHISYAKNIYKNFFNKEQELKIFTIHAFCRSILQKFPLESGVRNDFDILDEYSSMNLIEKSFFEIINKDDFTKKLKELSSLTSIFNIKNLVFNAVVKLNNFEKINISNITEKIFKIKISEITDKYIYKKKENLQTEITNYFLNIDKRYIQIINEQTDLQMLVDKKISPNEYIELAKIKFLTLNNEKRKSILKKSITKNNYELQNYINFIQDHFYNLYSEILNLKILQNTSLIYEIVYNVSKIYKDLKFKSNILDYNDLIIYTKNLLQKSEVKDWVQYKLDGGIDHILVDEAQDTSIDQWIIIHSLFEDFFSGSGSSKSDNKSIFVVGDVKQSIYGFQGARPDLFELMRSEIKKKITNISKNFYDINLSITYRLSPAILEIVKRSFAKVENFKFSSDQISFRKDSYGRVEVWPIIFSNAEERIFWNIASEINYRQNEERILANKIAFYIRNLINSKTYLPSQGRFANESDFLILVEKRSNLNSYIEESLYNENIGYAGADRLDIARHIAILDLIAAAKYTYLPNDKLNLFCLLKSPIFNHKDEDFLHFENNIELNNNSNIKLHYIVSLLKFSPEKFFQKIVNKFNLIEFYKSKNEFDAVDAIYEFLNLVYDLSYRKKYNLFEIVNFFENNDINIKRELNLSGAVRIMTVHGSKGLQAPIVIIADKIDSKNMNDSFLETDDENCPFLWPFSEKTDLINNYKDHNKQKLFEEKLRLLYVAMTRAEDILVISSCSKKNKSLSDISDKSWYKIVKNSVSDIEEDNFGNIIYEDGNFGNIIYEDGKKTEIFDYEAPCKKINEYDIVSYYDLYEIDFESMTREQNNFNYNFLNYSLDLGNILHKLMEDYVKSRDKNIIIEHYLLKNISQKDKEIIINIIRKAISHSEFENIINKSDNIRTEFSIGIKIDDEVKILRIDLVVFTNEEIYIIDYKSDINFLKENINYNNHYNLKHPDNIVKDSKLEELKFNYEKNINLFKNYHRNNIGQDSKSILEYEDKILKLNNEFIKYVKDTVGQDSKGILEYEDKIELYKNQIEEYKKALTKLYPSAIIKAAIFWLRDPSITFFD